MGRTKGETLEPASKLKQAAKKAARLAVVFPAVSAERNVKETQSAILALIEDVKGDFPELNDDAPDVPDDAGTRELEELSSFFLDVGERIDWE